jgi:hypothetical protein
MTRFTSPFPTPAQVPRPPTPGTDAARAPRRAWAPRIVLDRRPLRRQTPGVRTACGNSACAGPCGGAQQSASLPRSVTRTLITKAVIRPLTTARPTRRRSHAARSLRTRSVSSLMRAGHSCGVMHQADDGIHKRRLASTGWSPGTGETARPTVYVNARPCWAQAIGRLSRAIGRKSRTGGRVCHTRRADNRPCRA